MRIELVGHHNTIGPWICQKLGIIWTPDRGKTLAVVQDKKIVAAVLYESFNGASIQMHIAAEPGKRWMTKRFLWMCFHYPFEQLGCKKIVGPVPASNKAAQEFDEHLGFKLETRLVDVCPDGDMLLYTMRKEDCRWLKLTEKYNGQALSACAA